jgi:glycosyltransferase involved in cell wall biosynthesis
MKPRLLFVSNLFPDQAEPYRGLDNATILHHLRDRWDIQVIALRPALSAWWGRAGEWQPRPEDEVFSPRFLSVPYVPRAGSFWNHCLMAGKLKTAIKQVGRTFDWQTALGAWLYPDGCALVKSVEGRPVHLIAQGTDVHRYLAMPARRKAIQKAVQGAASVITRSQSLSDSLLQVCGPSERIRAITNGVDVSRFRYRSQAETRQQLGVEPQDKVVLFVGNLLPVKDPGLLLQMFSKLTAAEPDGRWRLVMIGKGPLKDWLVQEAAGLGIASSVRILGPQPADQVALWMNAADVLCLTSRNEGLPNVVLEALASGLPVVATHVGGIAEAVDAPWKGRLCETRSPSDIAAAVLAVACSADREQIASLSARSWAAAAADYHQTLVS